jgi:hypothetical protein
LASHGKTAQSRAVWRKPEISGSVSVSISTGQPIPSAYEKLFDMKKKLRPKGEWQAIGMQEARLEKGSPEKLRMRARQLRDHAERLSREAEELEERAAVAEKAAN